MAIMAGGGGVGPADDARDVHGPGGTEAAPGGAARLPRLAGELPG
jgi:hypothetical protein